jgi:carbon-monoxide dehydrogenase medium subunit
MIPAKFDYYRPGSLDEAVGLLSKHGEDAKVLAGGHSLLPAMKLRLAQPKVVVDIGRIADLKYIREQDGRISIGPMATHFEIETSPLLRDKCPLLPAVAPNIGDAQVRNKGTIGGSLVHADPGGDWPAAILALDADLELVGPAGRRSVRARDFFVDMLQSAVRSGEILCGIRVPLTPASVAYAKFAQKASGFAIAGVAVLIDKAKSSVAVGITGVAPKPYRASGVESALRGKALTPESASVAAERAADGVEPLGDIHASPEFRAHLAKVQTKRALQAALQRV